MTITYKPTKTLTIANGASLSDGITLGGRLGVIGFLSPAVVDGNPASPSGSTSLVIWGSVDGVSFFRIYDKTTQLPVLLPLGPAEARYLPIDPLFTAGCAKIAVEVVKEDTPTVGIVQSAARSFTAVLYEV